MITNIGSSWPWPRIGESRRAGETTWFQSTRERYWEALEVLPPVRMRARYFVMGEAAAHDARGVPIYAVWYESGDPSVGHRYFVREVPIDQVDAAISELLRTLAGAS